jgi:molecular chaperone GrpE (heat shock protein)
MAPKKRKPRVEYGWKPLEPVEINAYEPGRTDYTQEENYEAYKVFCIMDIDNSGCVSNREVRRLLTGHREKFITFEFDHPDTGIIWGLDKEDNVIVKSVEPFSPASKRVEIVRGFRLRQVNGVMLPQKDKNGLKVLHKELIRAAHGSVIFQVYEPSFILNRFSTSLDIEVDGVVYSVTLPVGAMNDLPEFEREIEKTLASTNKLLSRIKVSIDPVSKAVKFYSTEFPFRLLFATGPNYQTSCRYALGFWAYDFPYDLEHSGQPLYIDLKLDLTEVELDILLDELFESFDSDGSGEFRFEEFRNFYIQFLCNDEKLALLKKYAAYRFRDLEEEARLMNIMNNRRKRIERKRNRASKNAVQIKKMEQTLKDKTRLDEDHVRRRIYDHKKEEHITRRYNKVRNGISLPLKDSEETAIVEKKEKAPPESPVSEELQKSRERNKLVTLKQQLARNLKLHKIFEDDHQRKARAMQETAESERQQYLLHMGDLIDTFRRCLGEDGGRMKSVDGPNGEPRYTLRYDHVVRSPAVKMLSKTPEPNYLTDIDLIDLSSSELHPAAKTYFMIKNEPGREFDSSLIHPSFFGAQFERERSKAPHVGLGAARSFMQDIGASGVEISPKLRHRNPDFWSLPIAVRGQDWIRKKVFMCVKTKTLYGDIFLRCDLLDVILLELTF